MHDAGVNRNGSPLLVMFNADHSLVNVYQDYFTEPSPNCWDMPATCVHSKDLLGTNSYQDLLRGEGSSNGESSSLAHSPSGFVVCHGLIIAVCQLSIANSSAAGGWDPVGIAVCALDVHGLTPGSSSNTLGWKLVWRDDSSTYTQEHMYRGAPFSGQGYRVLDTDVDSSGVVVGVKIAFADYVQNDQTNALGQTHQTSNGGRYYVLCLSRTSASAAWTIGSVVKVADIPGSAAGPSGLHAHPPYIERWKGASGASNGLRVVCPVGDSANNNRVLCSYCNDETGYATPSNWTVVDDVNGGHGSGSVVAEGNQFVGSAALHYPQTYSGQIIGCDESIAFLHKAPAAPNGTSGKMPFARLYGVPTASTNASAGHANRVFNCFHVKTNRQENAGPFVAMLSPGSQTGWNNTDGASRILRSMDGETWGQAWAPNHANVHPIAQFMIAGSTSPIEAIFMGSRGSPARWLRSAVLGDVTVARPLAVAAGGSNRLKTSISLPTLASGNLNKLWGPVSDSQLSAMGFVRPCKGPVFRLRSPANANDVEMGVFQLTDLIGDIGADTPARYIKVRFHLLPLQYGTSIPAMGSDSATTQDLATAIQPTVALGKHQVASGIATVEFSRQVFAYLGRLEASAIPSAGLGDAARAWTPITLDADTTAATWASDLAPNGGNVTPGGAFNLGLRIRSRDSTPANPCDILIAFDYVLASTSSVLEHTGAPLPLDSSTPDLEGEKARVTGISIASDSAWTIEFAGEIPDDAWDHTDTARPSDRVICTFWESSSSYIEVFAIPSTGVIRFRWNGDSSTDLDVAALTTSDVNEQFWFLRGSPFLISISRSPSAGYTVCVSVGGTRSSAVSSVSRANVRASEVRFGDKDNQNVAPMNWYGGRINESTALDAATMTTNQHSLDMLYQKQYPVPPAPEQ